MINFKNVAMSTAIGAAGATASWIVGIEPLLLDVLMGAAMGAASYPVMSYFDNSGDQADALKVTMGTTPEMLSQVTSILEHWNSELDKSSSLPSGGRGLYEREQMAYVGLRNLIHDSITLSNSSSMLAQEPFDDAVFFLKDVAEVQVPLFVNEMLKNSQYLRQFDGSSAQGALSNIENIHEQIKRLDKKVEQIESSIVKEASRNLETNKEYLNIRFDEQDGMDKI